MSHHDLPLKNADYGTQVYWNTRYTASQEPHDWFATFADIARFLIPHLTSSSRILHLGCGTSKLSQDLYDAGYKHICNVDYSDAVITAMRDKYQHQEEVTWHCADITQLPFHDACFDVALDKGTLDALLCEPNADPWSPSPAILERVNAELDQVVRVLKPRGVFVYVTFGQAHFRKPLLERPGVWDVSVSTIGDTFHYFVYICKKIV